MPGIGDHAQTTFGHDGWDPPENYGEYVNNSGGGGGGGVTDRAPARFKVPEPDENPLEQGKSARKRFLIVGAPFYMWEHGLFKIPHVPRGVYNAICLKQNKLSDVCALCDDKRWPSYGAYFTVVDMGFVKYTAGGAELIPEYWTDSKGKRHNMQFRRRLMVAKKGGKDNPGQLAYFEDQRNRRGDLTGCVFDTMRTGRKKATMGDVLEFVERVGKSSPATPAELREYLSAQGAPSDALDWKQEVEVYDSINQQNVKFEETLFTRITTARMLPMLYTSAQMEQWLGMTPVASSGVSGGDGERALTSGASYQDDDVPF